MKLKILFLSFLFALSLDSLAQAVALKTNLFYGGYTLTPNLGVEVALGDALTLDIGAGYNPWNLNCNETNNKKLVHCLSEIELRYWTCCKYNGFFVGVHALGTLFNISNHNLPWLLGDNSQKYRFEGYGYGGGVSVGYQFILAKRWNLELNVGGGYARLNYDKYDAMKCGKELVHGTGRNYWGITRAGFSLLFIL